MIKKTLLTLLILGFSTVCLSQSVLTTITTDKQSYKSGEICVATINIKNTNAIVAPFTVNATATWTEADNSPQTSTASSSAISITHPVSLNSVDIILPTTLVYQPNTAFIGTVAVPVTSTPTKLTLNVSQTLIEQQSISITTKFTTK